MKKVVILASGSGSNASCILKYFESSQDIVVVEVITNRAQAGVIAIAESFGVPVRYFPKEQFVTGFVHQHLIELQPDLIVLAGFLLQIPVDIVRDFEGKIVNIHPALLPNYGGHGMYGMNVHRAVFENQEAFSGITIHWVNENYDEGGIIFQEKINLDGCQNPDEVAQRVLSLEHRYYPQIIEQILKNS